MSTTELLLIDLSSLAYPLWHISGSEPDPNWTSTQIVARVRGLSTNHPHAAICCDSGKSFRNDLAPTYKANRDSENRAVLQHQIALAVDRLRADGYPIWSAKGYEADDVIASATTQALAIPDTTVLIATADKDLLQLVSERVTVKNVAPNSNGNLRDVAGVREKFGVSPEQMNDYLCLVGDASDNVPGAKGIGGVTAAKLLKEHGSLSAVYEKMQQGVVPGITPAMRTNLMDFRDRWPMTRELIALRTDVPVPLEEIAAERSAPPMEDAAVSEQKTLSEMNDAEFATFEPDPMLNLRGENVQRGEGSTTFGTPQQVQAAQRELTAEQATDALGAATAKVAERIAQDKHIAPAFQQGVIAASQGIAPYQPPQDFSQQLEPRNMNEAIQLSQRMYDSRMFSAYGVPQAVLAVILAGRELGMPAMASLRNFFIIEGKPTLSSAAIQALVLKSGKATYFRCTERTAERATFEAKRGDDPPLSLTYTVEEAKQAWRKDQKAWELSGWGKHTADMLVARAASKLARLVFPDVCAGLYDPSEIE